MKLKFYGHACFRVTGADAGAPTTPVRRNGFSALGQKGIVVRGITFDYCVYSGLDLGSDSEGEVYDCAFFHNGSGAGSKSSGILETSPAVGSARYSSRAIRTSPMA